MSAQKTVHFTPESFVNIFFFLKVSEFMTLKIAYRKNSNE